MFDWDQDNVIVTGSTDGIVRVSTLRCIYSNGHVYSLMHAYNIDSIVLQVKKKHSYAHDLLLCMFEILKVCIANRLPFRSALSFHTVVLYYV